MKFSYDTVRPFQQNSEQTSHNNKSTSVLDYFGLDPIQCANTYLFDQDNFPISPELYSIIMPQFTNPTVYIKLVFNLHEDTGFDLVSKC